MAAEILYLPTNSAPIGQFIRVGHSGHRQLETLHGAGHIPIPHAVIDASEIDVQRDLVHSLRESATDIVLDTNIAELSSIGRFDGAVQKAAWANLERPLRPSDFKERGQRKIIQQIAEFSVAHEVDTVLAPTHLIHDPLDEWVPIDISSCELLREELNKAGGKAISIDYPLIIPYLTLRDTAQRRALVRDIANLPVENIWLRISGFGADASPIGLRRYIANVADFHSIGKPIVADCIGGLAGLGVLAFGSVSAISHGVGEKERFETNSWNMRPRQGGGGQSGRLYFPGLDRHFKLKEAELLMKTKGGRRLLACQDRDCCAVGYEDTVKDAKGHFLKQRRKQLDDLERTHQDRRVARFLDHHLASADRIARQAAKLKVDDDGILAALNKATIRLDKMRSTLENLDQTIGAKSTRAVPLKIRASVQARTQQNRR